MREGERDTVSRIAVGGAERPRLSLLVMGEQGVFTHPLPEWGEVTIGRAEHCDVVIADAAMSREHARLRLGDRVELVDLASSNGTRVGNQAAVAHQPVTLPAGEVVSMGGTVVVLQRSAAAKTEALATGASHAGSAAAALRQSGTLQRLRAIAARFAAGTIPVLLLGETGVGKDVLSALIHELSPRAARPYVCINCAALPEALLESELFGYERGAFTGATSAKAGLLESARGGTVFLDEVGEMPLPAQAKLLRVLDQGEVMRLGGARPRAIDVRFIAATNRDLEHEVRRGTFRADLYYRLAAAAIVVPPLRDRVAEIAPLARTFLRQACKELRQPRVPEILPDALALLERHSWPGNIRELRNAMERAVLLAGDRDIGLAELPHEKMGPEISAAPTPSGPARRSSGKLRAHGASSGPPHASKSRTVPPGAPFHALPLHVHPHLADVLARHPEAASLLAALDACSWNQTKAAAALGVSRRTLVSRLTAYGLTRKRGR